jgi:hypothetical protein
VEPNLGAEEKRRSMEDSTESAVPSVHSFKSKLRDSRSRPGGLVTTPGPGIAATTMRPETIVNVNRGRIRGWAAIAAVLLVALAALSWPNFLGFTVFLAAALAAIGVAVWAQLSLPDVEEEEDEESETRDTETGERD